MCWSGRDIKAGTCSNRCPPDCTTDLQREHLIQSNKKLKDFNFSLKLVTVADETTVSGRKFQTLITDDSLYDGKKTSTLLLLLMPSLVVQLNCMFCIMFSVQILSIRRCFTAGVAAAAYGAVFAAVSSVAACRAAVVLAGMAMNRRMTLATSISTSGWMYISASPVSRSSVIVLRT